MIARISIFIVLAVVLPDIYVFLHCVRGRCAKPWQQLLWWLPSALVVAYTCCLSLARDFAPACMAWLYIYFALLAVTMLPKLLFAICHFATHRLCRRLRNPMRKALYAAATLTLACLAMLAYGFLVEPRQLAVRDVDIAFDDLPASFDGFTMVLLSDIHAGSIDKQLLRHVAEEIRRAKPDITLFVGDIKNIRPEELDAHAEALKMMSAPAPVYSVMGNHDYGYYISGTEQERAAMAQDVAKREREYGWLLLLNDHLTLRRGRDSIVVAGEEDYGSATQPCHADLRRTLQGVPASAFVVLMQHNPNAWRKHILPHCHAQLTLSGHTHGGQVSLMGLHASSVTTRDDCGLYRDGRRALYVTSGVGGLVPFRLGVKPELVRITLHKKTTR